MLGDYPALFLPSGTRGERRKRPSGIRNFHTPSRDRQAERLNPAFRRLVEALGEERVDLRRDAGVAERETVLVLEVSTSVPEFYRAVAKVDGLQYLLGLGQIEQEPDEDFYDAKHPDKALDGSLYLIFSDLRARRELLRLWERWKQEEELPHGFGRFADVFRHLKKIREWGPLDRIHETGLIERWREDLAVLGTQPQLAEIELWYHDDPGRRRAAERHLVAMVDEHGGRVLDRQKIERIRYHGMLVEVPGAVAQQVLRAPEEVRFLSVNDMMFVRPLPQGFSINTGGVDSAGVASGPPVRGEPVVGVLDGVPLGNHPLLAPHVTVHDPDGLASISAAATRSHGTAMSSLIVHGDLSGNRSALTRPIVARPVLQADDRNRETFPPDRLPIDVIHSAVVDLVGGEHAAAATVQIINLSLGDPAAVFHGPLSAWARLLDYLAHRYDILFLVSAGNHGDAFDLDTDEESEDGEHLERATLQSLQLKARSRGLLAPAEAINVLTVGATSDDQSTPSRDDPGVALITTTDLPAPYSALGRGFRRALKPDVLVEGGRARYQLQPVDGRLTYEQESILVRPPGVQVASPGRGIAKGQVNYQAGTSMAAAIATGEAARTWDVLDELSDQPEWLSRSVRPLLVRALLVHAAEWGQGATALRQAFPETSDGDINKMGSLLMGYGRIRWERLHDTVPNRITLLVGGALGKDESDLHTIPLPPALNAIVGRRRLTTTMAWCSPLNAGDQRYRNARLWTFADKAPLALTRLGPDQHEVQRGTIEHIIYEGKQPAAVTDQSIQVQVSCSADAGDLKRFVSYGLAISIEAAPELNLPIYQQVSARVRQKVRTPTRTQIRP